MLDGIWDKEGCISCFKKKKKKKNKVKKEQQRQKWLQRNPRF